MCSSDLARLASLQGTSQTLLVERGGIGRTECFAPAKIAGVPHGVFVAVRVTGAERGQLTVTA